MAVAKKRSSAVQMNILVDFVAENRILLNGKNKHLDADRVENLWEDVSRTLNSCGCGPNRSKAQWKKTFIDWKYNTLKKARDVKKKTGSSKANKNIFTTVEKKLMTLVSQYRTGKGINNLEEAELESKEGIVKHSQSFLTDPLSDEIMGLSSEIQKETFSTDDTGESSIMQISKLEYEDALSTVQEGSEAFMEEQTTDAMEILNELNSNEPGENRNRELDLKEMELKIRLLEARNRTKELQLKEIELKLKERELNILELQQ